MGEEEKLFLHWNDTENPRYFTLALKDRGGKEVCWYKLPNPHVEEGRIHFPGNPWGYINSEPAGERFASQALARLSHVLERPAFDSGMEVQHQARYDRQKSLYFRAGYRLDEKTKRWARTFHPQAHQLPQVEEVIVRNLMKIMRDEKAR